MESNGVRRYLQLSEGVRKDRVRKGDMWLCVVVLVAATVSCSRAFSDLNPHHFPSGILKVRVSE